MKMGFTNYLITLILFALIGTTRAQLVINEIHYNPPEAGTDVNEFIEIYNAGASAVDMTGYSLGGVSFTFPSFTLNAGEYVVLAVNALEFENTHGFAPDFVFGGALLNTGETVTLFDASAATVDAVTYGNSAPWPSGPNGNGPSLELLNPAFDNSQAVNWGASTVTNGTPKAQNSVFATNQVPAISNTAHSPAIPGPADNVTVSADITDGDGTITAATLYYDTGSGFTTVAMTNTAGDTYEGTIPNQADLTVVRYYIEATDDQAATVTDPDNAPTSYYRYQVNGSGFVPDLVVNEILYFNGTEPEFIEVYLNSGSAAADLSYWTLSDGFNNFILPSGTSVAVGDYIIFTNDLPGFTTKYPSVTNPIVEYPFGLATGGESVVLSDPNGTEADRVDYQNGTGGWPATTLGFSIELISPGVDNNVGTNWQTSANAGGNPGQATVGDATPPDLLSASATSQTTVQLQFNENVDPATAGNAANYSIDNGITVSAAQRNAGDFSLVDLTVSALSGSINYTVTVTNVEDLFGNAIVSDNASFSYIPANAPGDVIITEIMQNPGAVTDANGEWFEVYNTTSGTIDMNGWIIEDNGSDSHTINNGGPLLIGPGAFLVFGRNGDSGTNGGYPADYVYSGITLANTDDEVVLVDGGTEIDRVYYDGGPNFPSPSGASMALINFQLDNNLGSSWTTSSAREPNFSGPTGDSGSPGTIGSDQTLPVSLSAFSVSGQDKQVTLSWVTESEVDNLRFEILRATAVEGPYQYIGEREGQLTTNVQTAYSFIDRPLINGLTYWYKLVDVDINGVRYEHGPVSATPQAVQPVDNPGGLPREFKLYANYPNPFNPETTIKFDIPEQRRGSVEVSLTVFNTLGQRVTGLFSGPLEAGSYQISWDGTSDNGSPVSGGVYYALFQSELYVNVLKMTYVK